MTRAISITFKSLTTGREHVAVFDLGSEQENHLEAVRHAWRQRASIIAVAQL